MKLCPRCGNTYPRSDFIDNVCKGCYEESYELKVKDIKVELCPNCKHLEPEIMSALRKQLKKIQPENIELEIPAHKHNPGVMVTVDAKISLYGNVYVVPVKILYRPCKRCSKAGTKYFEGVIQLRDMKKDMIEKVISWLGKEKVFINRQDDLKNGVDLYLSSKNMMQKIGKKLSSMGFIIKYTSTLHTRDKQKSRDVFRDCLLARGHPLKVGEIKEIAGETYKVTKISKDKITALNIKTGKKVFLDTKRL